MAAAKPTVRVNDSVFFRQEWAEKTRRGKLVPHLLIRGGTVKNIDKNGVASVAILRIIKVPVSELSLATRYSPLR